MIAILTDVTKCIGCWQCVDACARVNGLGPDWRAPQDLNDGLSARRWTSIVTPASGHYVRKQCRHCLEPACVSVCPVGALYKTPEGAVVYDSNKCMGCRYCMMACPYGIPRYQWDAAVPLVRKCTFCYDRLKANLLPACVEICPKQATIFGEREALLAEAHRRLRAEPNKYIQRVYGEHEVGGTSVLYISDVPLDFLSYTSNLTEKPLPDLTWVAMASVPPVALGVMALMAGTYWVIKRRMQLMGNSNALPNHQAESEHGNTK